MLSQELIAQLIVSGLGMGFIFALIAIGLTLIYGVMNVVNFAHGEFAVVGMYAAFLLFQAFGLDPIYAAVPVAAMFFFLGYALQRMVINPFVGRPEHEQFILLVSIAMIVLNLLLMTFGPDGRPINLTYALDSYLVGPLIIDKVRLMISAAALAMAARLAAAPAGGGVHSNPVLAGRSPDASRRRGCVRAHVDPAGASAYFITTQPSPLERQIYRLDIASGDLEQLTQEPGFYLFALSGDGQYLVEQFSDVDTPPITKIVKTGDGSATVLSEAAGPALDLPDVTREFVTVKAQDGADLYATQELSFPEAALGATIEVPTLDGKKVEMTVPAGTQPGEVQRLKGLGMPRMEGYGKGDLYIRLKLVVPKRLTAEQKELLRKFDGGDGSKKRLFGRK